MARSVVALASKLRVWQVPMPMRLTCKQALWIEPTRHGMAGHRLATPQHTRSGIEGGKDNDNSLGAVWKAPQHGGTTPGFLPPAHACALIAMASGPSVDQSTERLTSAEPMDPGRPSRCQGGGSLSKEASHT